MSEWAANDDGAQDTQSSSSSVKRQLELSLSSKYSIRHDDVLSRPPSARTPPAFLPPRRPFHHRTNSTIDAPSIVVSDVSRSYGPVITTMELAHFPDRTDVLPQVKHHSPLRMPGQYRSVSGTSFAAHARMDSRLPAGALSPEEEEEEEEEGPDAITPAPPLPPDEKVTLTNGVQNFSHPLPAKREL